MHPTTQTVQFDPNLLRKYDRPLPRYTSYPPATELTTEFQERDLQRAIARGNQQQIPLSLYCHIPFCETPCYFCGCNTVITQRKQVADPYLNYLERDIQRVAGQLSSDRTVQQLHWGGGTPNYLSQSQVDRLWEILHRHFTFADNAELSLEVNPRYLDRNYVQFLRSLGFNRVSFGIQDFNPRVQEAVNRIQPEAMLFDGMSWMREAGFDSVNVDLIYGLPYQTLDTFRETILKTVQLNPDRIAVFNFAYVPWIKPIQKHISQETLPRAAEKLAIMQMTIETLISNGYVFIGMDHFAKPDDELAIAQRQGQLHRNFQGYTTQPESELFGFGMTSISMLHDVYVQNHKRLGDYYRAIDADIAPIERGVTLTQDDIIRRTIIMELMCQFQLSKEDLYEKYDLSLEGHFEDCFATEQEDLHALAADGLVELSRDLIRVTPAGRLLIRNVASVFDTYLRQKITAGFSQSI